MATTEFIQRYYIVCHAKWFLSNYDCKDEIEAEFDNVEYKIIEKLYRISGLVQTVKKKSTITPEMLKKMCISLRDYKSCLDEDEVEILTSAYSFLILFFIDKEDISAEELDELYSEANNRIISSKVHSATVNIILGIIGLIPLLIICALAFAMKWVIDSPDYTMVIGKRNAPLISGIEYILFPIFVCAGIIDAIYCIVEMVKSIIKKIKK